MKYKTLSIIIAVYNEDKFIAETIEAVFNSNTLGLEKEIIIIDDGSQDNSKFKISHFASRFTRDYVGDRQKLRVILKTIFKKQNEGKGAALREGFLKSTGDIVLVQDADLEYSPSDYPVLLKPFINSGADIVYGSRFIGNNPHRVLYFWHYVGNILLTTLSNVFTNLNISDMETGFKVFKGDLIRSVAKKLKSKRFGFEPEITARMAKIKGIKIFEVGISYQGRTYEEGKKIGWVDGLKTFFQIIRYNLFD